MTPRGKSRVPASRVRAVFNVLEDGEHLSRFFAHVLAYVADEGVAEVSTDCRRYTSVSGNKAQTCALAQDNTQATRPQPVNWRLAATGLNQLTNGFSDPELCDWVRNKLLWHSDVVEALPPTDGPAS